MGQLLVEADDRWLLSIQNAVVDQCCFDFAVTFRCSDGPWELRIEQPFEITERNGVARHVDPERGDQLDAALTVLWAPFESASAFKDGRLELRIGGSWIAVPPSDNFEAWTVAGPEGLRVVSMPGGEVAIWTLDP